MKHSIIMPAYNAQAYIEQSVSSALSELSDSDEIIIVDDGSTDATNELVRQMRDARIRLLCQPTNCGIAAARNRALAVVSGDYVHFLDHDDLWPQDRMATLSAILENKPVDILSGWVAHFYCPSLTSDQRDRYQLPPPQAAALPGSVVIRRALIEQVGAFDVRLSSGEFIDFMSRLMALKPHRSHTDHVLFFRRIHGQNHTLTDTSSNSSYLKVVRRHLARNRAAAGSES